MSAKNLMTESQAMLSFEKFNCNIVRVSYLYHCFGTKVTAFIGTIIHLREQLSSKAYLTLSAIAEKAGVSTEL